MRVKNADGDIVSVANVPAGCRLIIVKAGATVRGVTYFKPAMLVASDHFAEYLIEQGAAELAEEVK